MENDPNRRLATSAPERPQERLEKFGAAALSDTELLALLLRSGTHGHDGLTLAAQILAEAGSIPRRAGWKEADFRRLHGIGRVKAAQRVAMRELGRRSVDFCVEEPPLLSRADLVARHLQPPAIGLDVEKFWALGLNRKNRLPKTVEVTSGTTTSALAHPREVFRAAIRESGRVRAGFARDTSRLKFSRPSPRTTGLNHSNMNPTVKAAATGTFGGTCHE